MWVVIFTSDHPATARAIARQAGITADEVLPGVEMAELDDATLAERTQRTAVFACIMRRQEPRLVQVLLALN